MASSVYDPTMRVRDARAAYFEANSFGENGGYDDAWVEFALGPFVFPIPNTAPRIAAVKVHDLHHLVTGYATDAAMALENNPGGLVAYIEGDEVGYLALIPFGAGWFYAVVASVLGLGFLIEAHRLHRRVLRGGEAKPLALFHLSISYLTLLFVAVAVGQFV